LHQVFLLFFLVTGYHPAEPGFIPFFHFRIDTINLFIHEAGHLFLKPFWMWLYILGGSLVQVLLPAALFIVSLRQSPQYAVYPGFWTGENLVNVSAYIRDAPFMKLKLIAAGLIHDWNWLLSGNLDIASSLGTGVFIAGLSLAGLDRARVLLRHIQISYREGGKNRRLTLARYLASCIPTTHVPYPHLISHPVFNHTISTSPFLPHDIHWTVERSWRLWAGSLRRSWDSQLRTSCWNEIIKLRKGMV
jgi:hypothetical protein